MSDNDLFYFRQLTVKQLKRNLKEKTEELLSLGIHPPNSYEVLRVNHLLEDIEVIYGYS